MRYTVISHTFPLVKRFSNGKVIPYPNAKNVTSHSYEAEGLEGKYAVLRHHAHKGHALLKGNVLRPLNKEPRGGLTDKNQDAESIILDFDGIQLPAITVAPPLNKVHLASIADHLVAMLPTEYHNVSYIGHASASMGRKGNRISMHLEFQLTTPTSPKALKNYLIWLNLNVPTLFNQISLTASGNALKWPLDISLADNTRLIYLGAPTFEGEEDPIEHPEDRLFFVAKGTRTLDLQPAIEQLDINNLNKASKNRIKVLRNRLGLPEVRHKTQTIRVDGIDTAVVVNPDVVQMKYAYDNESYVYYNVNNGDSNGYWVHKYRPQVVYNFKGEPNFLFEKADPDTYAWHQATFKLDPSTVAVTQELMPLVFRDFATDQHYNGLFNPTTGKMETLAPAAKGNLAAFMAQHGGVMPELDEIQTWNRVFDPHDSRSVDIEGCFLNLYEPSPLTLAPVPLPESFGRPRMDNLGPLGQHCPTLLAVLDSICANDIQVLSRFLNWLAFILQRRNKTGTAWVFQGVEGTGKGVLADKILRPILAKNSLMEIQTETLEEQYNKWREYTLLVAVDEFRVKDSASGQKLFNKIKNMITEPHGVIRAMRENHREVTFYDNYMFFSNEHDILSISDTDRRFNVAPRQETPLIRKYPDIRRDIIEKLPQELPLFASYLMAWNISEFHALTAMENDAKSQLAESGRTSIEEFANALRNGDMDYFLQVFDVKVPLVGEDWVSPAQNVVRKWVADYNPQGETKITAENAMTLYNVLVGPCDNGRKFGKNMSRHGLRSRDVRYPNNIIRKSYVCQMELTLNSIDDVRAAYLQQQPALNAVFPAPEYRQ